MDFVSCHGMVGCAMFPNDTMEALQVGRPLPFASEPAWLICAMALLPFS